MTLDNRARLTAVVLIGAVSLIASLRGSAADRTLALQSSTSDGGPTFAADVAPIVYKNCSTCHRPGQAAPFSLLSYDDVKRRATLIVNATGRRYMPPWHATPAPGFPEFRDARRLSDADVAIIKAWVDAGMPAGDLSKAPAPPTFPEGWPLGTPDIELSYPVEVEVPAGGPDLYRNVVLPLDRADDVWITAVDFEPSARTVVHHALFFAGSSDSYRPGSNDNAFPGIRGGATVGIGGWVPGMTPRFFPDGIAQPLPAHTNVIVQLHLHPSGKIEHEHGKMAIYLSKQPPKKRLTSVQVPPMFGFASGIDIPAGEKRYTIKDSFVLPVDVDAYGARGHAHYLAREMKMTATLPDGAMKGLLWIGEWDFGWQDSYFFATPMTLPKGTRIDAEIVYDNTELNTRNPNSPPKRVKWGLGTFDEMGSMTLLLTTNTRQDDRILRQTSAQKFRDALTAMFLRNR
jgi:mono/diheme cytochrome c family protein